MSFGAILAAIRAVCEGTQGSTRTVSSPPEYHVASPLNERVRTIAAPYKSTFDVRIDNGTRHPASPLGTGSYAVKRHNIRIDIQHELGLDVLEDAWNETRAAVATQCEAIVAALHYPGNVLTDPDDNETGIISGQLLGPEGGEPAWEITQEDRTARLFRSQIRCTANVQHERAVA